jgi:hypothetical protein
MRKLLITLLFAMGTLTQLFAQTKPIGTWTDHLAYQKGTSLELIEDEIYCATTSGMFSYNYRTEEISRYNTTNILTDIVISKIKYAQSVQSLIVYYEDANIDIITGSNTKNLPALKENRNIPDKGLNEIYIYGQKAFLAINSGIIEVDLQKKEFVNYYRIVSSGSIKVNDITIQGTNIYAATDEGIYEGDLNNNLLDFNQWQLNPFQSNNSIRWFTEVEGDFLVSVENTTVKTYSFASKSVIPVFSDQSIMKLSNIANRIVKIQNSKITAYDDQYNVVYEVNENFQNVVNAIYRNNALYVLNTYHPLLIYQSAGVVPVKPNSPFEPFIFDMQAQDGQLWGVAGGHDFSYNSANRGGRIYRYKDGQWTSYIDFLVPELSRVFDITTTYIDPSNPNHAFFGSWGYGMVEYDGDLPFNVYRDTNSTLQKRSIRTDIDWISVGEVQYDNNRNLWGANGFNDNLFSVMKPNGNWTGIPISNIQNSENVALKELEITNSGHKWVTLPSSNQILVFNENGTIDKVSDDQYVVLDQSPDSGNIPGSSGMVITLDQQGQMWLGTSDGLAVHYSPESVFEGDFNFERIIINTGNDNEILLGGVSINDIDINGANQKWIATNGSGVFLLSSDGKEELLHFTTDNSPLFSNNIISIAVDNTTGEVYFATDAGLIAYQHTVTEGAEDLSNTTIYPNPVSPDYYGPIAIKGLINNTTVKITDVSGNLVNQITSAGGQAIWNGNNLHGERVTSGVYLLFYSAENSEDNLKTEIGKILFLN